MKKTRIEVMANARNVAAASLQLARLPSMHAVRVTERTAYGETLVRLGADVFYDDERELDVMTELSGLVQTVNGSIEEVRTARPEKLPGRHAPAGYNYVDLT